MHPKRSGHGNENGSVSGSNKNKNSGNNGAPQVRTSDRIRRPASRYGHGRGMLYYSSATFRKKKKSKTRTAAAQIAKMLKPGGRPIRTPNNNSISNLDATNLRRSTRKRRVSVNLGDYTDSSGTDEDLMKPRRYWTRSRIDNTTNRDDLLSSKRRKVVETTSTPRREGLRPRRSKANLRRAPLAFDDEGTSEEKDDQDEIENGNDGDHNDDEGEGDDEGEAEGVGEGEEDGEGEDEREEDGDDEDGEEGQDGRRRYDLRNRADVRRHSMEEGKQRPRSPRRVLHHGMGTKVSRDVRKGGTRVHKRHRFARIEDSDDSLLVDELDQGPAIPWARSGNRSQPPWLFGGMDMPSTSAWGLNVAASGWGHQTDSYTALTSGIQTAGPSSKGGADIQPVQVDDNVSFDDIGDRKSVV